MTPDLRRRVVAEALGTTYLVAAVIGSGIAASRLSPHDVGLQLLEQMVAECGGRLDIDSTPGRGTRVEVKVPAGR